MKRVKAACLTQTLHFMLKEDIGHSYAVKLVNEEVKKYKLTNGLEEIERSIIVIRKVKPTPIKYPRNNSQISKKPL